MLSVHGRQIAHRLRHALFLLGMSSLSMAGACIAGLLVVEWFPARPTGISLVGLLSLTLLTCLVLVGWSAAMWGLVWQATRTQSLLVIRYAAGATSLIAIGWLVTIWLQPVMFWQWRYALTLLSLLLPVAHGLAWPAELVAQRLAAKRSAASLVGMVWAGFVLLAIAMGANLPEPHEAGLVVAGAGLALTSTLTGLMMISRASGVIWLVRAVAVTLIALSVPSALMALRGTDPSEFFAPLLGLALLVVGLSLASLGLASGSRWDSSGPGHGAASPGAVLVRCPQCDRSQMHPLGEAGCAGCGLPITVTVRWSDCPGCGYSLRDNTGSRCPECGCGLGPVSASSAPTVSPADPPGREPERASGG
jgi:hypothetical protein